MAEQEDVLTEVEAVQAVYGDDCVVLYSYPPHLNVYIKPRTADISSQQFVEAIIGLRAGPKYPMEPPLINLVDSKGLDVQRQKHLIRSIQDKACELSSCSMLVALFEEAVERLSVMNHPDGDCPLCLYPLVPEDGQSRVLPFMKLMSCFHCFHSECMIRWWNWLQNKKESNAQISSNANVYYCRDVENQEDMPRSVESIGSCPVCRKVFHTKDFEHVLDLVGTHSSEMGSDGTEVDENEELLQSDMENRRRQKFEAILKLQQENSGLIETRKDIVVLPGMFLSRPVTSPTAEPTSTNKTAEQRPREPASGASAPAETNSSSSSNISGTSKHRNSYMSRQRVHNPRKPVRQWIRKENGTAG